MLLHKNISLIEYPMISINFLDFNLNHHFDVLLISSANALESLLKNKIKPQKPVWCVGEVTKQKLIAQGFEVAVCFNYANDLNAYILEHHNHQQFLWLRGNKTTGDLTKNFDKLAINCQEICVYETILNHHKFDEVFNAILFFSPSAIQSFLQSNSLHQATCFCIGETTASSLPKAINNPVVVANTPSVTALIKSIKTYYQLN